MGRINSMVHDTNSVEMERRSMAVLDPKKINAVVQMAKENL